MPAASVTAAGIIDVDHIRSFHEAKRCALAPLFLVEIDNTMSRNRIPYHIERSLLLIDTLRGETGLGPKAIGEAVRRQVYAPLKKLSEAPSSETVAAYFSGKRPIPFDPPGTSTPSWLMAVEHCFPGFWRYFFHPIFNLLGGRVQSSEKTRARGQRIPDSWIDQTARLGANDRAAEFRAINADLDSRARVRSPQVWFDESLKWVHANMYALVPDAREILLTRTGLARGWRRRFNPVEQEVADLEGFPALEALSAAFALHIEANLIRDTCRSEATRSFVVAQLPRIGSDPTLRRVREAIDISVRHELIDSSFARYFPEWIAVHVLPDSWRGLAYQTMRNERFARLVSR